VDRTHNTHVDNRRRTHSWTGLVGTAPTGGTKHSGTDTLDDGGGGRYGFPSAATDNDGESDHHDEYLLPDVTKAKPHDDGHTRDSVSGKTVLDENSYVASMGSSAADGTEARPHDDGHTRDSVSGKTVLDDNSYVAPMGTSAAEGHYEEGGFYEDGEGPENDYAEPTN
jgi:hypothetical protein